LTQPASSRDAHFPAPIGLERLCRYAIRPPFALDRLSRGEDGRLVYRMKRPRGGSLFLLLAPDELLAKLATRRSTPWRRRW
jgi:hypothetical protein